MEDKFTIGTRVSETPSKSTWHEDWGYEKTGEVISIVPPNSVVVKWDEKPYRGEHTEIVRTDNIVLETEAKAMVSELCAEFDKVQKAIFAKMEEAAKAMSEAVKIANEYGKNVRDIHSLYDGSFRDALEDCGWSSSSMVC